MAQINRKSSLCFLMSLACFTMASSLCFSLPSVPVAQSGRVEVSYPNSHTMVIKASDDAIIHYEDFQVGPDEEVLFEQSSASHLILGKNPSQILGSIQSKGTVVLVNSNGVTFGPNSKVDTGSLLVSTLDSTNTKYSYRFSGKNSAIVNEGLLSSSKGSITLLSPHICNKGSLEAGSVFLVSGEMVKLEGSGVSVSGSLKEGLIEQSGNIQALSVLIKLPMKTKSITKNDVTHDLFIEENGSIILGSISQMKAQKISVEGAFISIQGLIDATSHLDRGGEVHLFGKEILLHKAKIDSSGIKGGGEVLIGGEFQGQGTTPYASKVMMDEFSKIRANSVNNGDGGLVVLWSQDQTLFDGHIQSQGGISGGNGGLVETSSQGTLITGKGIVDTLAAKGKIGQWLLDPTYMDIVSGDDFNSYGYGETCPTNTLFTGAVGTDKFLNLKSSVTVSAWEGITIFSSLKVTGNGCTPDVTFKTCQSGFVSVGDVNNCSKNIDITTSGGDINLDGVSNFYLQCAVTTVTTNGGNVNFGKLAQTNTCYNMSKPPELIVNAGQGKVTMSTMMTSLVPEWPYLQGPITVNSAASVKTSGLFINGALTMGSIPLLVVSGGSGTINTNGHDISIGTIDAGNSSSLSLIAGPLNTISIGIVGGSAPLNSFTIGADSASSVSLSNVTTTGGDISILSPLIFSGSSTLKSQGGTVYLGSSTASKVVTSDGDMNFADNATATGTFTAGNNMSFAGSANISGSFTAGGSIQASGSLFLVGTSSCTASNGITIGSQISSSDGNYDLTLDASTGPISIGGNVWLRSLTVKSASNISLYSITTEGDISIPCPAVARAGMMISSGGGNVTFSSTLNPSVANCDLTINSNSDATAGLISLQGMGTEGIFFDNISLYGGVITLGQGVSMTGTLGISNSESMTIAAGDILVGGDFNQLGTASVSLGSNITAGGTVSFNGPLTITKSLGVTGTGGITLSSSILASTPAPDLTLDAGSHSLTIPSLGSSSAPFGALTIRSSNLVLDGDVTSNASISISSSVSISQATILTGNNGISITGAIFSNSDTPSLTLIAPSGPLEIHDLGTTTAPLGTVSLTGSYITLGGSVTSSASIVLSGAATITRSVALTAAQNIALNQDLSRSTDPFNLSLTSTSGTVSVQNLGSSNAPLGNISILGVGSLSPKNLVASGNIDLSGSAITLDASSIVSASGNITINNTGPLTIPVNTIVLQGNFTQTTENSVSLGSSIETAGAISFKGDLTITSSTVLQGTQGVTISKFILASSSFPDLTLDAGSNPLTVVFEGSESNPFGAISLQGSDLTLQGNLYSNTSIVIYPSITISADTVISSMDGYGGLALLKPVTASSGTPSLTVYAANALVDVSSLGSDDFPLGDIVLTGSYLTLNGDIVSSASLEINGAITITGDLALLGSSNITLKKQLLPSTNLFDLTLESTYGTVSVQSLGDNVTPLKNVSLIGTHGVAISGTITTTGLLTITNGEGTTICGPGTYPPCNSQSQ